MLSSLDLNISCHATIWKPAEIIFNLSQHCTQSLLNVKWKTLIPKALKLSSMHAVNYLYRNGSVIFFRNFLDISIDCLQQMHWTFLLLESLTKARLTFISSQCFNGSHPLLNISFSGKSSSSFNFCKFVPIINKWGRMWLYVSGKR